MFYLTPKNGWLKHDFLVTLNVPLGVHERVENLLIRIRVHDFLFYGISFRDFFSVTFYKILILKHFVFIKVQTRYLRTENLLFPINSKERTNIKFFKITY